MTAPITDMTMLQMLTPVTPFVPRTAEAMKPPTIAPTTPSAMSMTIPEPVLLTILLAIQPAISPRIIQLIMPIQRLLEPSREDAPGFAAEQVGAGDHKCCGMDGENASG